MSKTAIYTGLILIALGLGAYVVSGFESPTAMIPAAPGALILVPGIVAAAREGARKHAMHAAVLVALLGFLAGAGMVGRSLPALFGEGGVERPLAIVVSFLMALVCLVFIVLSVRSFIEARKQQSAGGGAE